MPKEGQGPLIEVFSGENCGYCAAAKRLLDEAGLAYVELNVGSDDRNRAELLRRLPRIKAVPQVFIDGTHVGGYEDLVLLREVGRLDAMTGQ